MKSNKEEAIDRMPYVPFSMGMIQPEWIYMNHYLDNQTSLQEKSDYPSFPNASHVQTEDCFVSIQISFHSRNPSIKKHR